MNVRRRSRREGGALALAALMLGLLVVAGLGLERLEQATRFRTGVDEAATSRALAQAKAALLDFAVLRAGGVYPSLLDPPSGLRPEDGAQRPGALPCPDIDGDGRHTLGEDQTGVFCKSYIGWLPDRRLNRGELRDGSGARLWYALSEMLSTNSEVPFANRPLNPSTSLNFDGSNRGLSVTVDVDAPLDVTDDVVAIVIAPGPALPGEIRIAGGVQRDAVAQMASWLDTENSDIDSEPATGLRNYEGTTPESQTVTANDRIVTITRAELMHRVQALAVAEFGAALRRRYYNPIPESKLGNCQSHDGSGTAVPISVSEWCLPWPTGTLPPADADAPVMQLIPEPRRRAGWLGHGGWVRTEEDGGGLLLEASSNQYTRNPGATLTYTISGGNVLPGPVEAGAPPITDSLVTRSQDLAGTPGPVSGTAWCALLGPELTKCLFEYVAWSSGAAAVGCAADEVLQTRRQLYMPFVLPASTGAWTVRTATATTARMRHFNVFANNAPVDGPGGWPLYAAAKTAMPSLFGIAGFTSQAIAELDPPTPGVLGGGVRVVRQCVPDATPLAPEKTSGRAVRYVRFSDTGSDTSLPGGTLRLANVQYPFQLGELEPRGIAGGTGDVSGLPYWFADNGWHQHVGIVTSKSLDPGAADNRLCTAPLSAPSVCSNSLPGDNNQLTVVAPYHPARTGLLYSPSQNGVTLAVVGAGVELPGQARAPPSGPPTAAYFEQPLAFLEGVPLPAGYDQKRQLVLSAVPGLPIPGNPTRNDVVLVVDKNGWPGEALRPPTVAWPVQTPVALLLP